MKQTSILCDICRNPGQTYRYAINYKMQPDGQSDYDDRTIDLCPNCVLIEFQTLLLSARRYKAWNIMGEYHNYLCNKIDSKLK